MATNIVLAESILKRLNALPQAVRIKFWEQLETLASNPSYSGLRNEKLRGTDHWAFSISINYRVTYIRDKTHIIITAIGTHKDVLGT